MSGARTAQAVARRRYRARLGRCYELAGRYVIDNDARLVHGTIHRDPYPPNPHAWAVLPNGDVWEPITERTWPADGFAVWYEAVTLHEYSRDAAMVHMLRAKHFGPWE